MPTERAGSMLAHQNQWLHCVHQHTAVLPGGGVQLDWRDPAAPCPARGQPGEPAGLVFDRWCVGYRSRPSAGAVAVLAAGESRVDDCPGAYRRPRGLAVDAARRLYVADPGAREAVVIDLEQRRVLRRIALRHSRPVDAVAHCGRVLILTVSPPGLIWLEGRRGPRPGPALVAPRCPAGLQPARIAAGPLVLWSGGGRAVIARPDGAVELELDAATDLDVAPDGLLVVAGLPDRVFRRFRRDGGGWVELEPVGAPDYDGGAIAHTPTGRIAFTTSTGIATTIGVQSVHRPAGSVISYRLDSGAYRTRWGRVFIDACLPRRTSVSVRFHTTDADEVIDPIDPAGPARPLLAGRFPAPVAGPSGRPAADQAEYPPLPSASAWAAEPAFGTVFRRPTGREDDWNGDGTYATYEAPVLAPPGRYLWFELRLTGTDQVSPRVRAVRLERPGHRLLNSLPLAWSRSGADADFLQRYLAPAEGMLHELDWRSAQRAILMDPNATPADKLDWLAGFAGLVLDGRWPEAARRVLVAEAYRLFTRRGTKAALLRLLALYLGREPELVEQWQLRGLGGTALDTEPDGPVAPRVGGSASATGSLGRFLLGGRDPGTDAYSDAAHRCTVLVPGELTGEQRTVVAGLLAEHRPAHVMIDLCELGRGMRVGQQLRVALTSFVGPDAGWRPMVVGDSGVGVDRVLGSGSTGAAGGAGLTVGAARLGGTRVR